MKAILTGVAFGALFAGAALAQQTATATFISTEGEESGTATLEATPNGVYWSRSRSAAFRPTSG